MFTRHRTLLLLLFILLTPPCVALDEPRAGAIAPLCWERPLDWLPEDTETLIVSQGPFDISRPMTEQFKFDEAIRFLALGPATGLQDGALFRELVGQKVLCATEGSRRFTAPRNLGGMLYQGRIFCSSISRGTSLFGRPSALIRRKLKRGLNLPARKSLSLPRNLRLTFGPFSFLSRSQAY
jgi:hypothetical protein